MANSLKKPYKITDIKRSKRFGLTAKDLKELRLKGCEKLQIPLEGATVYEEDGTEVDCDDYLHTLPKQSVLIFLRSGEMWEGTASLLLRNIDRYENNSPSRKLDIHKKIQKLLQEGDVHSAVILINYVNSIEMNIKAETKREDPSWFEGAPVKFKTKEALLKHSAESRVRGYLTQAKEHFKNPKNSKKVKTCLDTVIDNFRVQLKRNRYHGYYFMRSQEGRMCNREGWFHCEGLYNKDKCQDYHLINPYGSRESRIVFSTWNLDHVIEKSREVLPSLVEAAMNIPANKTINVQYFYDLLFTRTNLKLVHIACHDKREHDKKCDRSKFYIKFRMR